ncbi:MAG TPA: hypothetical protein VD996_11090 [Chitinophagaceae bacterium]|nr:hypothetical protein [Chitinophagaceae bacterium]
MPKHTAVLFSILLSIIACNNNTSTDSGATVTAKDKDIAAPPVSEEPSKGTRHFRGALKGGMKGDSIFFDVNADGTKLENLTFKGYWYCDGKLEQQTAAGPEGFFPLVNGKVNTHISEPPGGGATAWRFDLNATIEGSKASGTFRMNINALRCNTGTLTWEAVAD